MNAPEYLDASPLVAEIDRRGISFENGTAEARAWHRAKQHGRVSERQADMLAIRVLGLHPVELWPDWFDRISA